MLLWHEETRGGQSRQIRKDQSEYVMGESGSGVKPCRGTTVSATHAITIQLILENDFGSILPDQWTTVPFLCRETQSVRYLVEEMALWKNRKGADSRKDVYGSVGHADGDEGCGEVLR